MNHFEKKDFLTTILQLSDALGTISTLLEKYEQTKTHFRASLEKHIIQHSAHTHDEEQDMIKWAFKISVVYTDRINVYYPI